MSEDVVDACVIAGRAVGRNLAKLFASDPAKTEGKTKSATMARVTVGGWCIHVKATAYDETSCYMCDDFGSSRAANDVVTECTHEGACSADDLLGPNCKHGPWGSEPIATKESDRMPEEPKADVGTGFLYDWHQWLLASGIVDEKEEIVRVILDIPLEGIVKVYVVRNALVSGEFKPPPRIPADSPTVEMHVHDPQEHTT